jgi:glycosyltransferase involved in cell wall biosynthesis
VLGDIPSLREIWDDAAVFVPPDDPAALEAALNHLIHEPAHRAEFARRAGRRAARYTPRRMADAYLSVYGHLARRAAPAGVNPLAEEFVHPA